SGRRQDGDGREGRPPPRLSTGQDRGPVVVVRLRAGRRAEDRRLCRDRERRTRRHGRGPGGAEGLRAVLPHARRAAGSDSLRLMAIDLLTPRAPAGRAHAAGSARGLELVRRLDFVLVRAVLGLVAYGLWA